mmetsp:Transcript_28743/g.32866  ORF Transcript_28743/g.32866 Transcript_28743/m.32866 type:complete len:336 (+) Transcript_28743:42-1049(+)
MRLSKASNPLNQLLSSLQQNGREISYLLLIQHLTSFAQRQMAASSVGDEISVYQQAKVLTPSERARLDAYGNIWVYELATTYIQQVIWIETIGGKVPKNCHKVISTVDNPLGWDDNNENDNLMTSSSNLRNLNDLAKLIDISSYSSGIVIFESITPLLMLHGLHQTTLFLHQLLISPIVVIVPINQEILTPAEHILLEDLSNALLVIQDGTATLLRHGVRERGNFVRDEVIYKIDEHQNNQLRLLPSSKQQNVKENKVSVETKINDHSFMQENVTIPSSPVRERPGKITLKIEEEDDKILRNPTTIINRPQIYLEDDDPELEDIDEEDIDDDLDL